MRTAKGRATGAHHGTHERRSRFIERANAGKGVRTSGPRRRPWPSEVATMEQALDRLLADERQMQAHGRNPEHPSLYHAESVAIMDAVVSGSQVDPDAMWRVLDLLGQFHRSVEALDVGRNAHNRARRALRDMLAE
jgi:hypothetical protein